MPQTHELQLRSVQVITAALMAGMVGLAGAAAYLTTVGKMRPSPDLRDVLIPAAAALWFACACGAFAIPAAVGSRLRAEWRTRPRPKDAEAALLPKFGMLCVVRAALLEGPGLFGGVALLLTGAWPTLAVTALSLALLALTFPTRARLGDFVRSITEGP